MKLLGISGEGDRHEPQETLQSNWSPASGPKKKNVEKLRWTADNPLKIVGALCAIAHDAPTAWVQAIRHPHNVPIVKTILRHMPITLYLDHYQYVCDKSGWQWTYSTIKQKAPIPFETLVALGTQIWSFTGQGHAGNRHSTLILFSFLLGCFFVSCS